MSFVNDTALFELINLLNAPIKQVFFVQILNLDSVCL